MGRLLVVIVFALFMTGLIFHFAPSTQAVAFNVPLGAGHGTLPISWLMMIGLGFCYMGHRFTAK